MQKIYGYVRVSTREQNEARQMAAMKAQEIPPENLFMDKQSGCHFRRPAYQRMLRKLGEGDVLYVHSIDRLGRNYDDILEQWTVITRQKGADIVVMDFPLLDTRDVDNGLGLTGRLLSSLILQILAYVAQQERENIRKRQAQGIAEAKADGKRWGNQSKELPVDFDALYMQWQEGRFPFEQMLEDCGMCRSTFYKKLREYRRCRGIPLAEDRLFRR